MNDAMLIPFSRMTWSLGMTMSQPPCWYHDCHGSLVVSVSFDVVTVLSVVVSVAQR